MPGQSSSLRPVKGRQPRPDAPSFEDYLQRQPGEEGNWLFAPDPERRYMPGSTVPLLATGYVQRSSGIFVPEAAARGPAPIDLITTYVTAEEIFDQRLGLEFVRYVLPQVSRGSLLRWCAELLGFYEALGASRKEIDSALVEHWQFREPVANRLRTELRNNRTLVTPQAILLLAQFALVLCPEDAAKDAEVPRFAVLAFAIQDALGQQRDERENPEDHTFSGETASTLFREVISNQDFNAWTDEGTLLARHHLHWEKLPAEARDRPGRVDLAELFDEATGVSKDIFTAVGTAIWAAVEVHRRYPLPISDLGLLKLERTQIEAALNLFAATPDYLAGDITKRAERLQTEWSFDVLRRYPVVRLDGENLLVLSKRLLLQRIFGWVPMFDVISGLRAQGRNADAARADNWFRAMCEIDALTGLRNMMPPAGGARRMYEEAEIQAAYGTDAKNADAALDYGSAWVVTEISTRHLTRDSIVAGDAEALARDFQLGIEEKVEQIDTTIRYLIEDESRLTGYPAVPRRRYVGMLIVTEGFPTNPMSRITIRERLKARGLLTEPRIGPLHILDQEELNMAEAVVEQGGPSLLQLLAEHERSNLRGSGFKDWLIVERGTQPGRPKRIKGPYERAWRPVVSRVQEVMGGQENLGD